MLTRKPRMLVVVASANRMASIVWAPMGHGGSYRAPTMAAYRRGRQDSKGE